VLTIGEMISVPEQASEEELAALSRRLEGILNDLTTRAELEAFAAGPAAAAAPRVSEGTS